MSEDLIRRSDAISVLYKNTPFSADGIALLDRCEIEIRNIPSIDIVRCKDCKYWVQEGNESFGYAMFCNHDCSLGGQGIKNPDDFCNYGEVRDE